MYSVLLSWQNVHYDTVIFCAAENNKKGIWFFTLDTHQNRYRVRNSSVPYKIQEVTVLKESTYKTYDDLPLFLNAAMVAQVLGVSPASSYELMHEKDFPTLRVGSRMVVPKEKFIEWVEQHTKGGDDS